MHTFIIQTHLDDETQSLYGYIQRFSKTVLSSYNCLIGLQPADIPNIPQFGDTPNVPLEPLVPQFDKWSTQSIPLKENVNTIHVLVICGKGRDKLNGKLRKEAFKENLKLPNVTYDILNYQDLKLNITDIPKIADAISATIQSYFPDRVIIPSASDLHQDHSLVATASRIGLKNYDIPEILEVYSPNNDKFTPSYYDTILKLNDVEIANKKHAIERYYTESLTLITEEKFGTLHREI